MARGDEVNERIAGEGLARDIYEKARAYGATATLAVVGHNRRYAAQGFGGYVLSESGSEPEQTRSEKSQQSEQRALHRGLEYLGGRWRPNGDWLEFEHQIRRPGDSTIYVPELGKSSEFLGPCAPELE